MLSGVNPFKLRNKTKADKLKMILEREIRFFPFFSSVAKDLLNRLLTTDEKSRLGCGPDGIDEIKRHEFFKDINW
jgi:serine/threonine protein kinase